MALSAKGGASRAPKEQPKKGSHWARVVGLTDLGHQPGFEFEGKEIPSSNKITFTYELVGTNREEDGRPFWVSEDINVNDWEGDGIQSKMMSRVRAIDPDNTTEDGKDLTALIGLPCSVYIDHNKKGYATIKGVAGVPEDTPVKELRNPTFIFSMDDPDMEVFNGFSEFVQNKITSALNLAETKLGHKLAEEGDY